MIDPLALQLEKFIIETISLAIQQPVLAAVIVVCYIQWLVRFGALADYLETIDVLAAVSIAIAEEVDGVDENAVAKRFNGGDSQTYLEDD